MSQSKRQGIFGGSFDPVHWGHLWIASAAYETLSLDTVRWIPAATSPLKPDGPTASDDQRLAMLRLATSGDERFDIDDRELRRGSVSYTVDTLDELAREQPETDWFLIIGGDSLASFDRWHQPDRIVQHVTIAPVRRGGEGELDYSAMESVVDERFVRQSRQHEISMPAIEISSRDLRSRIESKRSIRYFLPAAVESLIESESLYQ